MNKRRFIIKTKQALNSPKASLVYKKEKNIIVCKNIFALGTITVCRGIAYT